MASLAERIAAAKAAQGAAQTAPTVAAALAPAPAPAPAAPAAPAPAVPQDQPKRQEPKDRGQGPRREERRAPPPATSRPTLAPSAPPVVLPPVTSTPIGVGPLREGAYINPEETFRRVDEMRMRRAEAASFMPTGPYQTAFPSRFTQPRSDLPAPAPESALQSVDAYRTELDKRGMQYQRLSEDLVKLAEKRRELERIRAREGTPPSMTTVKRALTPTERDLESVERAAKDVSQMLDQARGGLREMGLTEEQIKLYN